MSKTYPPTRRVPPFSPVPVRPRSDGWTPARQARFLGALAETGSVAAAARAAGMGRETAYRLRRREGAESFAAAWDAVLAAPGLAKSTHELLVRRLANGRLQPLLRDGLHVHTRRLPDDDALARLYRRLKRGERLAERLARLRRERSRGE